MHPLYMSLRKQLLLAIRLSTHDVIPSSSCERCADLSHLLDASLQEGALQLVRIILCSRPVNPRRAPDAHCGWLLAFPKSLRTTLARDMHLHLIRDVARHPGHTISDFDGDLVVVTVLEAF